MSTSTRVISRYITLVTLLTTLLSSMILQVVYQGLVWTVQGLLKGAYNPEITDPKP